jgi:hypothetical protein
MSDLEDPKTAYVRVIVAIPADGEGVREIARTLPLGDWVRVAVGGAPELVGLVLYVEERVHDGQPPLDGPVNEALRELHRKGMWIDAWFPLADGTFECRLNGGNGTVWAAHADATTALLQALAKLEGGDD